MAKIEREAIVGHAIDLMLTGGYDGTSMAQISQACGIRKASLYHHFAEKDALVLAAIGQIHAHFLEHVFAIAWRDDVDAGQRLRKLGKAGILQSLGSEHYHADLHSALASLQVAQSEPQTPITPDDIAQGEPHVFARAD